MIIRVRSGHLTALDKRMVRAALDNGWTSASAGRKSIQLEIIAPSTYSIKMIETRNDDYGRKTEWLYRAEIVIEQAIV